MYPTQGAKVLQKEGAFFKRDFNKEGEMPSIQEDVEAFKQDNPNLIKQAADYKIDGYAFVSHSSQIKTALKNGMPISVAYPLYDSFYTVKDDGKVPLNKPYENIVGYHQMVIVGWTKNKEWVVLNSWGNDYGMKGVYYIPFGYKFNSAVAVTDTITPARKKANKISMHIDRKEAIVDEKIVSFDVAPRIINSRTYVPVRFVAENLGASVEWDGEDNKVTIRSEEGIIEMFIGHHTFYINGRPKFNDVTPIIIEDRTLLPIRSIAEALNCRVDWDGVERRVTISAL
jgi:hypothetical protein